jgi:hypothetical protein
VSQGAEEPRSRGVEESGSRGGIETTFHLRQWQVLRPKQVDRRIPVRESSLRSSSSFNLRSGSSIPPFPHPLKWLNESAADYDCTDIVATVNVLTRATVLRSRQDRALRFGDRVRRRSSSPSRAAAAAAAAAVELDAKVMCSSSMYALCRGNLRCPSSSPIPLLGGRSMIPRLGHGRRCVWSTVGSSVGPNARRANTVGFFNQERPGSASTVISNPAPGVLSKEQAQKLAVRLTADERQVLISALQEYQSQKLKAEYEGNGRLILLRPRLLLSRIHKMKSHPYNKPFKCNILFRSNQSFGLYICLFKRSLLTFSLGL